tara:strand:+ start:237 stop:497 length:261 start_codon:yes stop_codon:yes gene_type:complete
MKYTAEQVAFMLHEAIDENREYKSWHCSTQHLMALVERVVAEEREACAKVCETLGVHPALNVWNGGPDWYKHGKDCAEAIRARGNT